MTTVYLGLGSNLAGDLADPSQQVSTAIEELDRTASLRVTARSSLYESVAMGPEQPDYINAVVEVTTDLDAGALLDVCQSIERRHHRVRGEHWGPRTLDIDILLFGAEQIETERLQVPHAGLCEREFVVHPLLEIAPELVIPARGKLSDIADSVPQNGLRKSGAAA